MTGQFLQWKYAPCPAAAASCCAITPAFCPSHLISFCHLPALAGLPSSLSLSLIVFLTPHPPRRSPLPRQPSLGCSPARSFFLLLALYIPGRHVPAVSIHLGVALLIPPHLLSSALIPPVFHPPPVLFFSPPPCPISTCSSAFPLFFLIHFLPRHHFH